MLEHSVLVMDEMDDSSQTPCPLFQPTKDQDLLHRLAETAAAFRQDDPTVSDILNLCVALWGKLEFYSPELGESKY